MTCLILEETEMNRNCDEDSGRSSCSAASLGFSPMLDYPTQDKNSVKRRYPSKTQEASTNTDLKVSVRPRSCLALLKSPDEKDPFPSCRVPRHNRTSVVNLFNSPRKGGLSNAHSTLEIASSTQIELPKIQHNALSLNTVAVNNLKVPTSLSNFKRVKPVQRAASRLYRADNVQRGQKSGCVGPEFIIRASQPVKTIDLTLASLVDKRTLTVVLLNGQRIQLACDPNTITAGQLFEAIVYSEKYEHNFMLGIAALIGGDFVFLPDDYKIKKIAPENWNAKNKKIKLNEDKIDFSVFMRIKFFLPTNIARNIQGGEWRHRVYLQLRRSLVEGQLITTLQNLILLAGYALHIEFGEFTYREHGCSDYFLLEHYLPENFLTNDMGDVMLRMKRAHESRKGMDKFKAMVNYIMLTQTFRDYGAHFYSAVWATRDGFCRDVWLSIGPKGVTLYSRGNHISEPSSNSRIVLQSLPWHHIHTFYYNKKNLYIMPNNNSSLSKMGVKYKLKMTDNKSYFAFWLASLHHRLYLRLYAKEDFVNYLSDELSHPIDNTSPKKSDCSNFQDSYNMAVRNPVRLRKPVKKRFRVDLFGEKRTQNKENKKPNTEELLRQILSPLSDPGQLGASPRSAGTSSNDGLSSSESCSLPRRPGVKMGTRVFKGSNPGLDHKYPRALFKSPDAKYDQATAQSDSDDISSNADQKNSLNINSMKLLPDRIYSPPCEVPTAFVIESPKVYPEAFMYNTNESCLNASLYERLDSMGCVQGERAFVTAVLQRDETNALGLQVAEGSDGNVYINSITPGGPAERSKNVLPGDQIISVNGQTLLNIKYEKALDMLQRAPHKVELIVLQSLQNMSKVGEGLEKVDEPKAANKSYDSLASGLEDIEITDDELLNEEALKTIYALIKLTKDKVISRIKDKEKRSDRPLQKCRSENRVFDESDAVYSSQENTPEKRGSKFNTCRGLALGRARPRRRPLSLSVPPEHLPDDYLDDISEDFMMKTSMKSIESSLNSMDNRSVKSGSCRSVAVPRTYGLGRRWVGPVRYPVTPCKSVDSAIDQVTKKHFVYGAADSDDQIFL